MRKKGTLKTKWANIVSGAIVALVSACASTEPGGITGHYEVRVETPMYRYGPAQNFGPDMTLKQGQHVVLMRREYGYSRVMTDEGQSGYVATEDIVPTAPPKVAKVETNRYPGLPAQWQGRTVVPSAGTRSRFSGPVLPGGALFNANELPPLPEHEGPGHPKEPKPEFRFPKPKPGFRVNVPTRDSGAEEKPAPPPPETKAPAFR